MGIDLKFDWQYIPRWQVVTYYTIACLAWPIYLPIRMINSIRKRKKLLKFTQHQDNKKIIKREVE
jgi:hypothetical protein